MPLNELTKLKMPYRAKVFVYSKRRSALKARYGVESYRFKRFSPNLTQKIKTWKLAIRRIEAWEKKIKVIDNIIVEFLGVSAKNSGGYSYGDKWIARHFLCRYGKEIGILSYYL